MKRMKYRRSKGFTLIEVLIAGVILVSAISMATLVYRSSLLSSEKAERMTHMSSAMAILLDEVRDNIRNGVVQDSGRLLKVDYSWQAELIESGAPPSLVDPETSEVMNFEPRYRLWQVTLELTISGFSREYTFREVSW